MLSTQFSATALHSSYPNYSMTNYQYPASYFSNIYSKISLTLKNTTLKKHKHTTVTRELHSCSPVLNTTPPVIHPTETTHPRYVWVKLSMFWTSPTPSTTQTPYSTHLKTLHAQDATITMKTECSDPLQSHHVDRHTSLNFMTCCLAQWTWTASWALQGSHRRGKGLLKQDGR